MQDKCRTLEVFNTLEAFRRKEYRLVKQSVASIAIFGCSTIAFSSFLPESLAIVPTFVTGIPLIPISLKKAREADKVSIYADKIFNENKNIIMNYKINGEEEKEEFIKTYPILSKKLFL